MTAEEFGPWLLVVFADHATRIYRPDLTIG